MEIEERSERNYGKVIISFGPSGIASAPVDKNTNTSELHQLTLQHSADDAFIRNFLVSSAEIFCLAQKEYQSHFPHTIPQEKVAAISRMYRGLILELIRLFEGVGEAASAHLYANLEFVWNFCEIMFISSNPELPVLPYIKNWIQANYDDSEQVVAEFSHELPELDSESTLKLWNVIFKLIFHGRTADAAKYLILVNPCDSATTEEQITLMAELLRKKPEYDPLTHSVTDFEQAWILWKEECENRLTQGAFDGHDQLLYIVKVLIGDDEAFNAAKEYVSSWYEYLCMKLAYGYPTTRPSMLKDHAVRVIEELGLSTKSLSPMEGILLAAMDFNIVSVLRDMQLHWNYPWFTLHFSDLVYCGGQFSNSRDHQVDSSSVGPLRNEFVLDFGTTLMQHPTLWQVGVRYLEAIPDRGGWPVIKECLQRKKTMSDFEAQKVISVAERFGFSGEIHSICRENSLRKLKLGQMQNALLWSIKAGDGPLTTYILDKILFEGNCEIEPSVLDSLRNAIPCADRLLFLSGFCDFRKMMECNDYRGAISQLCHLIKEDLIPNRMAHKIMLNIQHFTDPSIKMESWQTTTLLQYLHTNVEPKLIGEDMFRQLNTVLLCHRAQGIIRNVSKAKKII